MSDGSVHDDDRLDIDADVEPEEALDDEADDVVDVDEDKQDGQDGLDLDMNDNEDDGSGSYHEEGDGEQENEKELVNGASVDSEHLEHESMEPMKDEKKVHSERMHAQDASDDANELLSRPPHGSEVFIGGVTRDTTEADLRELCCSCGEIYEIRILKDKETGYNKGYAFVTFTNRENAEKAIEELANSELKGRKLRFSHSQTKNRLFIGNVPKSWDSPELETVLNLQGPGVETVELLKDPRNPGKNRGFAFVDYYNNACADHARKAMSRASFRLGGNTPTVSWADPRNSSESTTATNQVKVVYVRNLPDSVTEEQLRALFERHGEITKVVLPQAKPGQAKRDFGFIHFTDRSNALKAIDKSETYELDGRLLEASLAKPPAEKKSVNVEQTFPQQRLGGLLPSRNTYTYPIDLYNTNTGGAGYAQARYNQPLIYGRGPPPAGMTMVPIQLPDGRLGYVLQQPGLQANPQFGRDYRSHNNSSSGGASSRRYRPY